MSSQENVFFFVIVKVSGALPMRLKWVGTVVAWSAPLETVIFENVKSEEVSMFNSIKAMAHVAVGAALLSAGWTALAQVSPGKQSHVHSEADQVCVTLRPSVSGGGSDVQVEEAQLRCSGKVKTLKAEDLEDVARQATLK